MPRRHTASGDASPSPQSTINVVPRQPRPPARLKLKFKPREPISEPEEPLARPKRKISRPARYLDNVCEPLTKKRKTTTASTMSLQAPNSPSIPLESSVEDSSDPILLTSSNSVNKSDYADSNDIQHAGYGADFLNNFIDDTPRSSLSALDSVIGLQNDHKSQSDFLPESDALPEAAELIHYTFPEPTSGSPTYPIKEAQDPIILSSSFSSLPQQLDDSEVCIGKLRNACHALSCLNMPPVLPQRHVPSPTTWLKGELELHDKNLDLTDKNIDAQDSVDALLAAAAGCDRDEDKQASDVDTSYAGTPDEDINLLIKKAIEILRHQVSHVHGLATKHESSSGRGKHSKKDKWNTEAEQLFLSTLEPLLYGGATNIGCIISSERANLMWQLYSQLTHVVTAPYIALSRKSGPQQQANNGVNTQYRMEGPFEKRSPGSSKGKAVKVPVPHHFLSRQKNPS